MKRRTSNRLSIENLERREMMAADAVLAGGVLSVTGTEQADHIILSQATVNGLMTVKVTITDIATGATLLQKSFMNSSVNKIKVECGSGNDIAENNTTKPSEMYGDNGADRLVGGSAVDLLFGARIYDQVENEGNTLIGNAGNDICYGVAANDVMEGGAGDDQLWGGRGDDTLRGGANNDTLFGDGGVDTLFGDDGNDTLYGKDTFCGEDDSNFLFGGAGHDQIFGAMSRDECNGDAGNDTIHGGGGNDIMRGGTGDDTLYGGDGNDKLEGNDGNDTLHGNNGDDECYGGAGNDFLAGGDGIDTLLDNDGSNGTDKFVFDVLDFNVDFLAGSIRWPWCPKLMSGPYAGHAVYVA
jgi:Ca2+-binding RTX toxin-like protein